MTKFDVGDRVVFNSAVTTFLARYNTPRLVIGIVYSKKNPRLIVLNTRPLLDESYVSILGVKDLEIYKE